MNVSYVILQRIGTIRFAISMQTRPFENVYIAHESQSVKKYYWNYVDIYYEIPKWE